MCDYSLMAVPNRLAHEGEELVAYRFPTGSLGLASPADVKQAICKAPANKSFWTNLKEFFNPPKLAPVPAVCIPPGARLRLHGIPARLQNELGVGPVEDATFTQISSAVNSYRDAVIAGRAGGEGAGPFHGGRAGSRRVAAGAGGVSAPVTEPRP
jgi:hypothetical protein